MNKDADRKWRSLAASQYGVLDRAQALEAGLSRHAISRRVASGEWTIVLPGVYQLAGAPVTWFQRLTAAVLWAGPGAAVSHRAAAALFGLPGFTRGIVEVSTTLPRQSNHAWVVCHRVRALPEGHRARWSGIFVTSADRTLLDLAGMPRADPATIERCLDEVLRRGLASRFRIAWTLRHARGPGRALLRRLLEVRMPGYVPPHGELEARWLRLLKDAGIPDPVREEVIEGDGFLGRVDYLWPACNVAVETDGFRWHTSRHAWRRDVTKRNLLARRGYRFMTVTWEDVVEEPAATIDSVRDLLRISQQDPHTL